MNIHTGGGAALLDGLLKSGFAFNSTVLVVDRRYAPAFPWPEGLELHKVAPSLGGRIAASRWIASMARPTDHLLCLGNLPPLFRVACPITLFIQNRYLLDRVSLAGFPLPVAMRLRAERLWLRRRSGAVSKFVVQTMSMRRLLEASSISDGRAVDVVPFMPMPAMTGQDRAARPNGGGFLYVASGEPHKNHLLLLDAWSMLAREGIRPRLLLTLDESRFPDLSGSIAEARSRPGVDIVNLGVLSSTMLGSEYEKAAALIYPSRFEAFGMPLIEAAQHGLPIIAPELDYVRDVAVPAETFDPYSALSLARAIKRFLGRPEQPAAPVEPGYFLTTVLERT